jgi:hypothetical protein
MAVYSRLVFGMGKVQMSDGTPTVLRLFVVFLSPFRQTLSQNFN